MNKSLKLFVKVLKEYNLTVEHGSKHIKVYTEDNRYVATASCSGKSNTYKATMRHLRAAGHVDDDACKITF